MKKENSAHNFFASSLLIWYDFNKRDLPWRRSQDPYIIWLSEIILQQTRVEQGMPYYLRFVERFPDIISLAQASEDEVFKLWQGLGYYNRARNLHYTAKYIANELGGKFPDHYDDVLALKGVGEYTASAIVSFAYGQPYAAVDGNVYRVLSRVFGVDDYIDTSLGKKIFQALASEVLDEEHPGLYNQAIMDFGAMQCVPVSPNCMICPFVDKCYAYNNGTVATLPRKRGKVTVRNRYFNYLDIRSTGNAFLKKREGNDIWKGLYELPLIETEEVVSFVQLAKTDSYKDWMADSTKVEVLGEFSFRHVLSHQIIHARFYLLQADKFEGVDFQTVKEESLDDYAVPKMIENYLDLV